MAIVIEEEKKVINWFAIIVVGVFVIIISAAIYYLFFINPASIESTVMPARLKLLEQTTQIKFDPNETIKNIKDKNLKEYVSPLNPESGYNPNPFYFQQ